MDDQRITELLQLITAQLAEILRLLDPGTHNPGNPAKHRESR